MCPLPGLMLGFQRDAGVSDAGFRGVGPGGGGSVRGAGSGRLQML